MARFMKVNDPEALEETFRSLRKHLPRYPAPAPAGIKMFRIFSARVIPKLAGRDVDEIVDMHFVYRLKREFLPIQIKPRMNRKPRPASKLRRTILFIPFDMGWP
jgi:hypothetical protein